MMVVSIIGLRYQATAELVAEQQMMQSPSCLLSINNYFYPRGGAEVLFLEQNRLFEGIGWHVVPFAMRHAKNLPSPWAEYFPDEIELGGGYGFAGNLLRAQRVIFSMQARQEDARAARSRAPAHRPRAQHLSPPLALDPSDAAQARHSGRHDGARSQARMPGLYDDGRQPAVRALSRGKIHNVAVNRCIKGSLALSSLVMVETFVHRLLRLYEANVSRFVVPSRFVLEKLVQWGWARERFTYIPNFVDVERFRPSQAIGRRFVYCGRLQSLKGVETLVRAAALAKQPLTMVGSGLEEKRLRELSEDLGADVLFLGHQTKEALVDVIQSARAIVVPSECNENAPLALLEGYAAGRPVIGSRMAGIPELVREGETGALFAAGEVEALAASLERFAELPDTRLAEMGAAGRRWVEQDFTAASYRDRLLALYGSLRHAEQAAEKLR